MGSGAYNSGVSRLLAKLAFAVVGMFCFGFALVPLYNVLCDITGINGKTAGQYQESLPTQVIAERQLTLQLTASNNADMPWTFYPKEPILKIHPGEINETVFVAINPTDARMTAQAVPSIAPSNAATYLHKTECFCFTQQTLEAGERVEMPVRFFVDQDIPERISKMTLSYTLFDVPVVAASTTGS